MSFCDEDVAVNCDECYELSASDCLPITIATSLTPTTVYWLICTDKFDNRYDVQVTIDANGYFTIDTDDFPSQLFNKYAGKFTFILSVSAVNVTPVQFSVSGATYSCVIVEWSVNCCNNTYVPPTACETFLDGLSEDEIDCICDNVNDICPSITCDPATVENSDQSYQETVASGGPLVLPDTTYNFYVNNVLKDTETSPTLASETFEIYFV